MNKKSHLASYGHILSGQKLPKITKTMINLTSFWNNEPCSQTVLPDRSILIGQKLVEKSHKSKIQMRHFDWFSNNVGINEKWVGCQVREG